MDAADVLIVGGGIIGLTAARALADEGRSVSVVDRADLGREASWAGAGIIPPGRPNAAAHPLDRLRALTAERLPDLSARLFADTGIDNGYTVCGGIEFLDDEADAVVAGWRAEGIACEPVDANAVRRLESAVVPPVGVPAWHLPGMAQVRNPRHLRALIADCQRRGVRLLPGTPVVGFDTAGDRVTAARTHAGSLPVGEIIVAAGAWTAGLLDALGCRPEVRPILGQIVLFRGPPTVRRVLLHGKRYLVPRPDGRVLVGSTEEDTGFEKRTTADALADLSAFAVEMVPTLAAAEVETSWAGLRPAGPGGVPYIGRLPGWRNGWMAAGHFRAGVQLSVGSAMLLADLVAGRPPCVDPAPFAPDRLATPAMRPAFRS